MKLSERIERKSLHPWQGGPDTWQDLIDAARRLESREPAAAPDLLAALERLTKSEMAICVCRPWGHGGPQGGGGSRNVLTGEWNPGEHAADCPHAQARAAIARARGEQVTP